MDCLPDAIIINPEDLKNFDLLVHAGNNAIGKLSGIEVYTSVYVEKGKYIPIKRRSGGLDWNDVYCAGNFPIGKKE